MRARRRWRAIPRPQDLCYIAVKPCGCVVEALAINSMTRFRMQRAVGEWLVRGYLVGRIRAEEARLRLTRCACAGTVPDPAQLALV